MSKFLAPIHTWLFNKIRVTEAIEKELLERFLNKEMSNEYNDIQRRFGDFLSEEPLENMIDQSNIHGWLQNRITIAEQRQAALIYLIPENQQEEIEKIYQEMGYKLAKVNGEVTQNPQEVFKQLGDVLLEGMPCDRVNQVIEQTDKSISWVTSVCVHKQNWEKSGVPVEKYYRFRSAFIEGFVKGINEKMTYAYSNEGQQVHTINL